MEEQELAIYKAKKDQENIDLKLAMNIHNADLEAQNNIRREAEDAEARKRVLEAAKASTITFHEPPTELDLDFIMPERRIPVDATDGTNEDRGRTSYLEIGITAIEVSPSPVRGLALDSDTKFAECGTHGVFVVAGSELEVHNNDWWDADLATSIGGQTDSSQENDEDEDDEEAEVPQDILCAEEVKCNVDSTTTASVTTAPTMITSFTCGSLTRHVEIVRNPVLKKNFSFAEPPMPTIEEVTSGSETPSNPDPDQTSGGETAVDNEDEECGLFHVFLGRRI